MTIPQSTALIFGLGYTGRTLAKRLLANGWEVFATVRRSEQVARAEALGCVPLMLGEPPAWPTGAHLVVTAGPADGRCPALAAVREDLTLGSVTYLSTTGVYGDLGGGWAFEWTPPAPGSDRGRARVAAENGWRDRATANGYAFRTVRLPGIYGPGRSAFDRLRKGRARRIIQPGQVFSRAHVDDIADALVRLLDQPQLSGVFHLCDDEPAPPEDVVAFAAQLMDAAVPPAIPIEEADLSPMAASFYAECKRVSNARAKSALGWAPAYPTYRDGLTAIWQGEG